MKRSYGNEKHVHEKGRFEFLTRHLSGEINKKNENNSLEQAIVTLLALQITMPKSNILRVDSRL
jgi:hypothetical protein